MIEATTPRQGGDHEKARRRGPVSLDGGFESARAPAGTALDTGSLRELDHREGDGIEVSLLWQADTDGVYVAVVDHRSRERFADRVDPAAARDAFHHPYAYHAAAARTSTVRRRQPASPALPRAADR